MVDIHNHAKYMDMDIWLRDCVSLGSFGILIYMLTHNLLGQHGSKLVTYQVVTSASNPSPKNGGDSLGVH